jgi:tRNA A37 threonylcarbamoyladenosine dehydratase
MNAPTEPLDADLERRFGGLRRLWGEAGYAAVRALRVAVIGVGGVGSWAAEALARSGVAQLTLIDLDHVAESNVNRQVQALGRTLGAAKVRALAERLADIHPGCALRPVEAFVDEASWPGALPDAVDVLVDACDQVRAKVLLAAWARQSGVVLVCAGAAGGKSRGERVEVADLSAVTHDPLLASVRQRLRQRHGFAKTGAMGVPCVFSREAVARPAGEKACDVAGNLSCHGYGSSVAVTATFGFVAAGEAMRIAVARASRGHLERKVPLL